MGISSAAAARKSENRDHVREARIAELRNQYRGGTYQVDSAELSAKLIDLHLCASRLETSIDSLVPQSIHRGH